MKKLWLDTETYSEVDLTKTGVYPYAADPSTEVTIFAYAIDDAPVQVWDITTGEPMPADLADALLTATDDPSVEVIAHNAGFDRIVLRDAMGIDIPLERWRCSMVLALCHALPASLAELGKALGLSEDEAKLADGKKLVNTFCKPAPSNHNERRYTRENKPEAWARFIEYAMQDVDAMRTCWNMIPNYNYNAPEIALWHLDQRINDRGFLADRALAIAGADSAVAEKASLQNQLAILTDNVLTSTGQRDQLLAYLNGRFNLELADLTKDTLEAACKRDGIDDLARRIMKVRLAANKTSTAKYASLLKAIGQDDRFRGGLQFAGAARTRRFAGRNFQPHNLPSRGLPKPELVEEYIDDLKHGVADLLHTDLMLLGTAALRGLVIAPPFKKLAVADLSNIEGRILAWIAGEEWKLEAFRAYDAGTGPDLYNITAVSIVGGDPWNVPKVTRNVFGKVPDLASGYRGGVPGYQTFAHAYQVRMADHWGTIQANVAPQFVNKARENIQEKWAKAQITQLEISDIEWLASETCKLAWRARHPATVDFWKAIQDTAIAAIRNPATLFSCGRLQVLARRSKAGHDWLYIKLPSGKYLTYFQPEIIDGQYGDTIAYMAVASEDGSTSRAWRRTYTHGGKLTGNICQTLAGDILKEAMPHVEAADYQIVLTVHDEIVAETADDSEHDHVELARIFSTNPSWAAGLPLSAAGFDCYRYKKE